MRRAGMIRGVEVSFHVLIFGLFALKALLYATEFFGEGAEAGDLGDGIFKLLAHGELAGIESNVLFFDGVLDLRFYVGAAPLEAGQKTEEGDGKRSYGVNDCVAPHCVHNPLSQE
jgi:hypothetical protein